jgi:hypothetical protein
MTPEQETHLSGIKQSFCVAVDAKYRRGQLEHGGNLWAKPGLFPMLADETLDFIVYAKTLEQQLRDVLAHIQNGEQQIAWQKLSGILDGPTD